MINTAGNRIDEYFEYKLYIYKKKMLLFSYKILNL